MAKETEKAAATGTASVKLNSDTNSSASAQYICQWLENGEMKSKSVGFEPVDIPKSSPQLQEGLATQTLIRV